MPMPTPPSPASPPARTPHSGQPTSRPTLAQMARHAGVSVASVSRALNGKSASRNTVERVRAAVNELGYVPDATARLLKLCHAPAIACAVPDIANPVYVEMVKAMEQVTRRAGYRLSLVSVGSDPDEVADLVLSLDRGFADGLILIPLRVTAQLAHALEQVQVPVAVIGRLPDGVNLDAVQTDSAAGIRLAVEHLVATGRRRIGLLNGPSDTTRGAARLAGYGAAMAAAGLSTTVIIADEFTTEAGLRAMRAEASRIADVDAITASNDLLAIGAMKAAAFLGRTIGDDLALVGMDNTTLADLVQPSLTSVSLMAGLRAEEATELVLDRIEHPGRQPRRITLGPELVVRESTGSLLEGATA